MKPLVVNITILFAEPKLDGLNREENGLSVSEIDLIMGAASRGSERYSKGMLHAGLKSIDNLSVSTSGLSKFCPKPVKNRNRFFVDWFSEKIFL